LYSQVIPLCAKGPKQCFWGI